MTEPFAKYQIVENPEPITALQSALDKLNNATGKVEYFETHHIKALREYIRELERENEELKIEIELSSLDGPL